jgi:transcriptional regulator with XRE-family HTH domain
VTEDRKLNGFEDETVLGPKELEPLIGGKLKTARLLKRRTLEEVAVASDLTKGFLSKIEHDRASPSVASLFRLCRVLEISVGSLFNAPSGALVRHSNYPQIRLGGSGMAEYLLTPSTERRLQAILSDIEPGGGGGGETYLLPAEVEFVFVIEGRLRIIIETDENLVLNAGDAFTFPSQMEHTFENDHAHDHARVLWVFAPALPVNGTLTDSHRADSSDT